jgi:hypothetical protein
VELAWVLLGAVQMKMQAQKLGPKYQARNWTALILE